MRRSSISSSPTSSPESDAAYLADLGINAMRIPINYRHFESDEQPKVLIEGGLKQLDRAVDTLAGYGIYSIIDLHAVPGFQNHHWHSDNPTHWPLFWEYADFKERASWLWEVLADHYKGNGWVAGFNLLNEPADEQGDRLISWYGETARRVRDIDPDRMLFLDGNRYSTDFSMFSEPLPNTVYTAHDYVMAGLDPPVTIPASWTEDIPAARRERSITRTRSMNSSCSVRPSCATAVCRSGSVSSARSTTARHSRPRNGINCCSTSSTSRPCSRTSWRKRSGSALTLGAGQTNTSATSSTHSSRCSPASSPTSTPTRGVRKNGPRDCCATSSYLKHSYRNSPSGFAASPPMRPANSPGHSAGSRARGALGWSRLSASNSPKADHPRPFQLCDEAAPPSSRNSHTTAFPCAPS